MRIPRLTIRTMAVVVLLLAADFAVLRAIFIGPMSEEIGYGLLGIIPMSSLLAFGLYRFACHRRQRRPFLIGFGVAGMLASAAWFFFCLANHDEWLDSLDTFLQESISHWLRFNQYSLGFAGKLAQPLFDTIALCFFYTLTTPPQLIFALSGGYLAHRLSKRRSRLPDQP